MQTGITHTGDLKTVMPEDLTASLGVKTSVASAMTKAESRTHPGLVFEG